MNEIIKVNSDNMMVSARSLHDALEISERFSLWMRRYTELLDEYGVTPVGKPTEVQNNGGIQIMELTDYELPIDLAKHICMMSKTEKGKEMRQYFIDLEKAWNTPEQIMARALKIANQQIEHIKEVNVQLLADNERMRPKEIFADAITASKTSILVGELAKILKGNGVDIGQKRLFAWLRDKGYLIKRQGTDYNMPTQKSMELKLFEIKEGSYVDGSGVNKITKTTKVTGKGQEYFINKFLSNEDKCDEVDRN